MQKHIQINIQSRNRIRTNNKELCANLEIKYKLIFRVTSISLKLNCIKAITELSLSRL